MAVQHEPVPDALTLQDAARELGVSAKTLKRWVALEDIRPAEDPRDRRRRLIGREELLRLRQLFGEVPSLRTVTESADTRVDALERQVAHLETALAALSARSAALADNIISLTQQVVELRHSRDLPA